MTNSPDFPTTASAFVTPNRAPGAQGDVFAVKLNPSGHEFLYSSVFGGNGSDFGSAIAVDASLLFLKSLYTCRPSEMMRLALAIHWNVFGSWLYCASNHGWPGSARGHCGRSRGGSACV